MIVIVEHLITIITSFDHETHTGDETKIFFSEVLYTGIFSIERNLIYSYQCQRGTRFDISFLKDKRMQEAVA